jgi:hypothetical protein
MCCTIDSLYLGDSLVFEAFLTSHFGDTNVDSVHETNQMMLILVPIYLLMSNAEQHCTLELHVLLVGFPITSKMKNYCLFILCVLVLHHPGK